MIKKKEKLKKNTQKNQKYFSITSWLNLELLASLLEHIKPLLGEARQVNVHAGAHAWDKEQHQGCRSVEGRRNQGLRDISTGF